MASAPFSSPTSSPTWRTTRTICTNFAITAYAGDTASIRAYVIGMGVGKDGRAVTVNGRYYFDVVRTAGRKAKRYTTAASSCR
jgi:hypothetical protein